MSLAVSGFMLKPGDDNARPEKSAAAEGPTTIPEIEAAIKRADDKERLVGLLVAPIAAAIGLLVTAAQIAHDPKATFPNGQIDHLHANPSIYLEFGLIAMVLALTMLAMAWFRKRLILGIATALYGLSIFNLHYWGFGLPFIMVGVVVPGACLPAAGEAQGGQGRRPDGLQPTDGPSVSEQAVHASDCVHPSAGTQAEARQGVGTGLRRSSGGQAAGRSRAPGDGRRRMPRSSPGSGREGGPPRLLIGRHAPPAGNSPSEQGVRISSHAGNTDVTVPKSPPSIVCGGKPNNCPSCP